MIDKKYQIFLSSTYSDLIQARKRVIETILNLYHHPVGMEMFSADDDEQWEVIKETINSSDYYIVLIGHRYGSITKEGISFTEKEYDYAKQVGIPVLAFVRDREVPTKPNEREDNPEIAQKVDSFVQKATKNKMCDFWETPEDLATKIAVALPKVFRKHKRPGWIRAESEAGNISEELARLSKENNQLRKENEKLRSDERKPALEIEINEEKELVLQLKEFKIPSPPEELSMSDVPPELLDSVNEYEITSYNSRIPPKEIIKELEDEYKKYWEVKYNSNSVKIEVINTGNSKANSVWVGIQFPEEIKVITKQELKDCELPPVLRVLENDNPIEKAEKKISSSLSNSSVINNNVVINTPSRRVKKNMIKESIKHIVHGMMRIFDGDYLLIPKKAGEYKAEVTLMCEEFEDAKHYDFPIIVEEENT